MLAIKWCMITLFVQLCFWFVVVSIFFYCNTVPYTHQAFTWDNWRTINVTLLWASSCSFSPIHQIIYASAFLCIGRNVTFIQWYDRLFSSLPSSSSSSSSIKLSKTKLFVLPLTHMCVCFPFLLTSISHAQFKRSSTVPFALTFTLTSNLTGYGTVKDSDDSPSPAPLKCIF